MACFAGVPVLGNYLTLLTQPHNSKGNSFSKTKQDSQYSTVPPPPPTLRPVLIFNKNIYKEGGILSREKEEEGRTEYVIQHNTKPIFFL